MASQTFKEFLVKMQDDEAVREALRAAGADTGMPLEALRDFAQEHGYAFEVEDVTNELSARQLDAVTGGVTSLAGRGGNLVNRLTDTSPPGPMSLKLDNMSVFLSPSGSLMVKL